MPAQPQPFKELFRRADRRLLGGMWLLVLPALLFGVVAVLVPLRLHDAGWGGVAIGAVFLTTAALETVLNPLLGRFTDRRGYLLPVRVALVGSALVSLGFAWTRSAPAVAALVLLAGLAYGGFYTPGMTLLTDAAERRGISAALAFGAMNGAWAAGNVVGPAVGGWLAELAGDALPYLLLATVCLVSLVGDLARRAASAPAELAAEQPVEPAVRLLELFRQASARLRLHRLVLALVDARIRLEPVRRRAEELEHPRVRAGRIGGEVVARNDQQLLAREDLEPALELLGVAAARLVGVAPPLAAEVARVGDEPLHLAAQPLVLGGERVLERQRLAAERDLVVVVRQRAVDRVADERDESRLGNNGADALRCRAGGRGSSGSPRRRACRACAPCSGSCRGTTRRRARSGGRSS